MICNQYSLLQDIHSLWKSIHCYLQVHQHHNLHPQNIFLRINRNIFSISRNIFSTAPQPCLSFWKLANALSAFNALTFWCIGKRIWVKIKWSKAIILLILLSRVRLGGSKAVWKFSENWSILEKTGLPKASTILELVCDQDQEIRNYHLFPKKRNAFSQKRGEGEGQRQFLRKFVQFAFIFFGKAGVTDKYELCPQNCANSNKLYAMFFFSSVSWSFLINWCSMSFNLSSLSSTHNLKGSCRIQKNLNTSSCRKKINCAW